MCTLQLLPAVLKHTLTHTCICRAFVGEQSVRLARGDVRLARGESSSNSSLDFVASRQTKRAQQQQQQRQPCCQKGHRYQAHTAAIG